MTETIYEQYSNKEEIQKTFRFPSNRRQMGRPGDAGIEVFIEDYVYSYAKNLAEKSYTDCVAGVLVGESMFDGQEGKVRIEGILEAESVTKREVACFTEETWAEIYRDIAEYFPGVPIVGWFLGGPGFLLEDDERHRKIQTDNFGGDKLFLRMDSMEQDVKFFFVRNGRLLPLSGYYIYYEKNEGMQRYMMKRRQKTKPVQETTGYPEQRQRPVTFGREEAPRRLRPGGLLTTTGGVLACLAVLVIGAMAIQIRERERLQQLLNEREQMVASLCTAYEVKEGETVESICQSVYGSTEIADEIREFNGLEQGENPQTGQKILLP